MNCSRHRRLRFLFLRSAVAALAAAAIALAAPVARAQAPPGPIQLAVDASDAPRQILHAHLVIPAKPGALTLVYPKWLPGEHMPSGPIADLAGLKFFAAGKRLEWRRDLVDMFAFHLQVPAGAEAVEVQLDYLLAPTEARFSAGASASSQLLVLSWNQVLLYPEGWPVHELTYEPSLRLPEGWKFATALPQGKRAGATIVFQPVKLDTLVDSPVQAGAHVRVIELTPRDEPTHEIDLAADSEAALAMRGEDIQHYKQLVAEASALFGVRHYRDYHFLLTLSDDVAHFGLEHHESSDDRSAERMLLDDAWRYYESDLLSHEYMHSWNGKFRRPAGLATPDYQQPMKGDLLWVYEGLTQYLGEIMAARSGLMAPEEYREEVAMEAAMLDHRAGREWRSLQDTADSAQILYEASDAWLNWRRSIDFYEEGALIWLEVDATIRRESRGQHTLDDFCRSFYGGSGGVPEVKPYTFEDVVAALEQIQPYDWAGFLRERLNSHGPGAPLGGIEKGGWRLDYSDTQNDYQIASEKVHHEADLSFSLGMIVDDDGIIVDVIPGMPGAAAGLAPGMKITAVNGRQWNAEALHEAIRGSRVNDLPVEMLAANGEHLHTYSIDYHGGPRYPHLLRRADGVDLLDEIIRPLTGRGSAKASTASGN